MFKANWGCKGIVKTNGILMVSGHKRPSYVRKRQYMN